MAYYFPKAKLLLHKYSVAEKDRIPKQKPSQNATNVQLVRRQRSEPQFKVTAKDVCNAATVASLSFSWTRALFGKSTKLCT